MGHYSTSSTLPFPFPGSFSFQGPYDHFPSRRSGLVGHEPTMFPQVVRMDHHCQVPHVQSSRFSSGTLRKRSGTPFLCLSFHNHRLGPRREPVLQVRLTARGTGEGRHRESWTRVRGGTWTAGGTTPNVDSCGLSTTTSPDTLTSSLLFPSTPTTPVSPPLPRATLFHSPSLRPSPSSPQTPSPTPRPIRGQ